MFDEILTKIFGSRNDRLIKQYRRKVEEINRLEPAMKALSDDELRAKTQEFRDRIAKGATTDDLLVEAFAVVREAAQRVLGMRHFDVQLIGGMVLNDGKIAEMRTGEGKTLTATLAVYLNALPGKGCHVVTVNDYLASRDADWMGRLYNWLGLSVGKILSQQNTEDKRAAYAADITYGTNNEFGFDYLRDNMEYDVANRRQRGLYYAIVDEVDSILIDEARTPLIISGPAEDRTEIYVQMNEIPPLLTRQTEEKGEGDYWVDEKAHQVYISEAGHEKLEKILAERGLIGEGESLYSPKNNILMHHLNAALRAHSLFNRDQHYVVQNGEVVIVDEFTGRLMPGRRWSEGLHQAVEAKEGVRIQQENQTMASITFQNYFRMYEKLSGMTGTADTEAYEFQDIYGLETVVIPTHRKMIRIDEQDKVYRTTAEKYRAIIEDVKACHAKNQPVLLGTTSIENSELLSKMLEKEGIPHNVLNAKQHEREARSCSKPVVRAWSRSPRTWPAEAPTSCSAAASTSIWTTSVSTSRSRPKNALRRKPNSRPPGRSNTTPSSRRAVCASSGRNVTNPAASTISCAAVPAVRATRDRRASTSRWKTSCFASSGATACAPSPTASSSRTASPSSRRCSRA